MQDFRVDTFLAACRMLNYTETAKELNMTQPAVSQHIRALEEHYQTKLFVYEGKKLRLTDAGVLLRKAATTMKHDESILKEHLKTADRCKLVFGATRTIGDYYMPEILNRFLAREQRTDLCMLVDNTETLLGKIDCGELDFAFVEGYFHKAEYDYQVISRQKFIAVCGAAMQWRTPSISINDLFGECVILREQGSGTREILERSLHEKNSSIDDFRFVVEVGSIRAIKMLVNAGNGITFLYEAAAAQELQAGTLRKIPLSDFEMENDFTMVWRKNSMFKDQYLRLFNDFFGKRVAET